MIVKRFGCTAIHNKALYKCIIHSFIHSFIRPMLSNGSRGTLMSYTDHSVQRCLKSNAPSDLLNHSYQTIRSKRLIQYKQMSETNKQVRPCLRPNVHTIHPKFYAILLIFNTI